MSAKDFINKYLKDFSSLLIPNDDLVKKIISVKDIMINSQKNKS